MFAHVHLEKSVPADNAMLMKTPEELTLAFSKEVRVVKVTLKNKQVKSLSLASNRLKKPAVNLHGNYLN